MITPPRNSTIRNADRSEEKSKVRSVAESQLPNRKLEATSVLTRQIDLRYRLKHDALWLVPLASLAQAIAVIVSHRYGFDSHAYWMAWRNGLYGAGPTEPDAYLYSPAFAQVIWPLVQLPWPAFAAIYTLGLLAILVWLLKPLPLRLAIPLGLAGLNEVFAGNVFLIFALVVVLGCRYPASWAFVALTKVTPCIGPVWFLVRRDWRSLAISLLATAAVTLISVCAAPGPWINWLEFLAAHGGEARGSFGSLILPPLIVRLPVGLILVAWGASKDKRWTLPAAMVITTPVFGPAALAVLLALPRIKEHSRLERDQEAASEPMAITPGRIAAASDRGA